MELLKISIILTIVSAIKAGAIAEGPYPFPQFVQVRLDEHPYYGNAFDSHGMVYLAYYQHKKGEPVGAAHVLGHEEWTGRRAVLLTGVISRSLNTKHDVYGGTEPFESLSEYLYDGHVKRWVLLDGVSYARFGHLQKGANTTTQKHDGETPLLLLPTKK
jgi:hypothetical protein